MPAFQPYWGKPAVRNDRGDRGNVGIIRSPVRASILPDLNGSRVGDFAALRLAISGMVASHATMPFVSLGRGPMGRRIAGGKPAKKRRHKTVTSKRRPNSAASPSRRSTTAARETEIARLSRELRRLWSGRKPPQRCCASSVRHPASWSRSLTPCWRMRRAFVKRSWAICSCAREIACARWRFMATLQCGP